MQDQNWQLKNAQGALKKARAANGPKAIGDILPGVRPGQVWDEEPAPPAPVRTYQVTPLADFRLDHLAGAQRARLQHTLDKARAWLDAYPSQPGLSFVLAGPVGVGKTTIAENLMQAFREAVVPVDADGRNDLGIEPTVVLNGRLLEATRLIGLLGDNTPLDGAFGRAQVVVIDDAGEEDIPFTSEREHANHTSFRRVRQKRYGRFLDYCYRHGKHVLVTSMIPLLIDQGGQKAINPEFVDIFGQKAFSRLYQMARGYMCDLSGLPDYRPFMVEGIV